MRTLPEETIEEVNTYCRAYNEKEDYIRDIFDFISDKELLDEIVVAYTSARYIYKLGQGLACKDIELHAHSKFQITQYASIYEAVVSFMLEKPYAENENAVKLFSGHEYKPSSRYKHLSIRDADAEELFICKKKMINRDKTSIKFDAKVDCSVQIGFLHKSIAPDIKRFYKLRNGIHLSNAINKSIKYDYIQGQEAYRRIRPFALGIKGFLKDGRIPSSGMTKAAFNADQEQRRASRNPASVGSS